MYYSYPTESLLINIDFHPYCSNLTLSLVCDYLYFCLQDSINREIIMEMRSENDLSSGEFDDVAIF